MSPYTGNGSLRVGNDDHAVAYRMHVVERRGMKDGFGTLDGDYTAIVRGFEAGRATLVIRGGVHAPIVLSRISGPGRPAEFRLAGAPLNAAGDVVDLAAT